ncbi:hypothetical protein ACFWAT_08695 [Streptomyces syringium]|uniref:hypothetical protein n=1 Tax=Streptomyces syringium TaxID=76729 RepID=UPI00365F2D48
MRLRAIAFAATCALTFLLATPGSASAIAGEFRYKYIDAAGDTHPDKFSDPAANDCIDIPQADDPETEQSAHSPFNHTGYRAKVFAAPDCEGTAYVLASEGKGGTDMKFRSFMILPR